MGKIFAIHKSDKGLVYKMDKELIKLIADLYIWLEIGRRSGKAFFKRKHIDGPQIHERCSISVIIREMQVKSQWVITSELLKCLLPKRQEIC